jgi:predicted DNA-binding transcriptional regulator YafY
MSRGDGLARQLQLMQMLEHRQEIVVPEVAAELGYTVRTVYRDLQVLERVGVPIYQERQGRNARWRVMDGYRRRLSITLGWPEMMALALARKMLERLSAPPLTGAAASAIAKVNDALPREVAQRAAGFDQVLSAHLGASHEYARHGPVFRTLMDAIERRESVTLQHRKLGERAGIERVVDPYLLHVQSGAVYLIGFCHQRNAVRTFLLDRISQATRTGALFAARASFAASALLQGAIGPWEGKPQHIQLRFDADVAELAAERQVHPTQMTQWCSNGELDVSFRAPVCPPLITWLLGWGHHVRVISPAALAARLQRAHARAANDGRNTSRITQPAGSARRRRH